MIGSSEDSIAAIITRKNKQYDQLRPGHDIQDIWQSREASNGCDKRRYAALRFLEALIVNKCHRLVLKRLA